MSHVSRSKLYTLMSMLSFGVGVLALSWGVGAVSSLCCRFILFICHQLVSLFVSKMVLMPIKKQIRLGPRALVKGLEDQINLRLQANDNLIFVTVFTCFLVLLLKKNHLL